MQMERYLILVKNSQHLFSIFSLSSTVFTVLSYRCLKEIEHITWEEKLILGNLYNKYDTGPQN